MEKGEGKDYIWGGARKVELDQLSRQAFIMATLELNKLVWLYSPCNVLVCAKCAAGIKPGDGAVSHFRKQHKLVGEDLQQVAAFVASRPLTSDPATVDLPQDGSAPIDGLPQLRGYSCTGCRYLTVSRDKVVAHGRIEGHEAAQGPGWTAVTLQTFGRWKQARYWAVRPYEEESSREGCGALDGLAQSLQACTDMLDREAEERRRKVEEANTVANTCRWVRYMRWKKHLRGVDRRELREAGLGPLSDAAERKERDRERVGENKRMRLLADSLERELRRSVRRIDKVPTQTLKWLASVDATRPVGKPFDVKEKD